MIVYPEKEYNSWISEENADDYFETRLNSDQWNSANKETALITAFRDLNLFLDLSIDLSDDETPLPKLRIAQAEQTLWLLKNEVDSRSVDAINLGSGLFVKLGKRETRISPNAIKILSDYIAIRTIARTR